MISELIKLPILAQFGLLVLATFFIVGAFACMSFVLDVLVAAVRAASMTLMRVVIMHRVLGRIASPLHALSLWRDDLLEFYRSRHKRLTWTISGDGSVKLAQWSGVFRWKFFDLLSIEIEKHTQDGGHMHPGTQDGATTGEPK